MLDAIELATAHRLGIWDSVIVAASIAAGCQLLLSEDMQDGFSWSGLTVVNPMMDTVHPLLAVVLDT
jgi:predicted nucleic acid-binding protein